jgi:hypothetical protein
MAFLRPGDADGEHHMRHSRAGSRRADGALAPLRERHNGAMAGMPRFWIGMQIVIVICVLISAVIVIVKL